MERRLFLKSIMGLGVAASVGSLIDFDSTDLIGRGYSCHNIILDEFATIDKEVYASVVAGFAAID